MNQQHNCLVIKPRGDEPLFGDGKVSNRVPCSDWSKHIDFFERQMLADGDSEDCVIFTAQESFDSQMDFLISIGAIDTDLLTLFNQLGFMDTASNDGQAHFHTSPRFVGVLTGNGTNGNALTDPWTVMKKYGALPSTLLPVASTMTIAEYYKPISQANLNIASQFLTAIGGSSCIQGQYITDGTENVEVMQSALPQAPLCISVNAIAPGWNQVEPPIQQGLPDHSIMCYGFNGQNALCLDHYVPYEKIIQQGFPINYSYQGIVTPVPPPPAPVPPTVPITPPNYGVWEKFLVILSAWLKKIQNQ
jgi:hypothetical protein